MKCIPLEQYFLNTTNIEQDIKEGYKLKQASDFQYLVKGESVSNKNFLFSKHSKLLIIDSVGNIKNEIVLEDPNEYKLLNACQISTIKYAGFFINIEDATKNYLGVYCKDLYDNNYKCIEKYTLIDSLNTENVSADNHTYIYKEPGHVYLYAQNRDPNIEVLQEQKDGNIIWEWRIDNNSTELAALKIRTFGTQTAHINCIKELSDNLLLISFRNIGIACLNKQTNTFEWFIAALRNDLNFEYTPQLQHHLEILDSDKSKFATFNNNWIPDSMPIESLLDAKKFPEKLLDKLTNCGIIIYDLKNKTSNLYNFDYLGAPRLGSIIYIKDNIFDINYGFSIVQKNNILYNLGIIEEKNLDTNEIYFSLKFPDSDYNFQRIR